MHNELWYKDAVFYQISVRAFKDSNGDGHGDLRGLTEKLDYIQNLGVDCIWIMPIYPSPLRDDGYDIADYYNVSDEYGKLDDLKGLIAAAHERGIRIIMDLVLNHTSDRHPWFRASRSDKNSPYRSYYVWSDTDKKYEGVRIIFGDIEKSNWAWDDKTQQYYWHRFFSSQPDLNFDNPAVQAEMLNVVRFWLTLGIDGFRVDAPTYLFEREGTNCESLPETHTYLKRIRYLIDNEFPEAIMLAESNQWPQELSQYFSSGDEFHMAFHFPLMPRIFLSLAENNAAPITEILKDTPSIPENCQWAIFLRNHDELSLEMVTDEERKLMWHKFAPEPQMIHNLGIRRRLAPILNNDRCKIELVNSLLFTLPGSPIIYYGDEIGMGDNLNLPDRNGVRTPMQWNSSPNAGFTKGEPFTELIQGQYGFQHVNTEAQLANPDSLYRAIRRMVHIRKEHHVFGRGSIHFIETNDTGILAYVREHGGEKIFMIHNLGNSIKSFTQPGEHQSEYINLLNNETQDMQSMKLNPYSYHWMKKK
ncbi:MAG: maltose alpha-D-glucosyltransferase [Chloroflexi bacterium]|nr:maltose alpha-D-glucosyltransferase [Chloroflexota bacterium]